MDTTIFMFGVLVFLLLSGGVFYTLVEFKRLEQLEPRRTNEKFPL